MNFLFVFALGLLLPQGALANETTTASLCDSGVAGTYVGQWQKMPVRLNIFCLSGARLVASLADITEDPAQPGAHYGSFTVSYGYATVSGDHLIFSSYGLSEENRREASSKTRAAYMKLNLAALLQGQVQGYFVNERSAGFLPLSAKQVQTFPVLTASERGPFSEQDLIGLWRFQSPYGPSVLLADVLAGIPSMTLSLGDGGNIVIHLIDGPKWDSSGLFSMATAQADGEDDGLNLYYIFGRLVGPEELEFYYLTPISRLMGPFKAHREKAPLRGVGLMF